MYEGYIGSKGVWRVHRGGRQCGGYRGAWWRVRKSTEGGGSSYRREREGDVLGGRMQTVGDGSDG